MIRWLDFLFPPRVDEFALRAISLDDFLALVAPHLVNDTRPSTIMLLPFSDARVRMAIHEAKYRGNQHAFMLLSSALADYLRDIDDAGFGTSSVVIVPVPLGKERHQERGFNQVEEIAQRALLDMGEERKFKIDAALLERTRETVSQVSLPRRKREENMRGAFRVVHGATQRIDPACTYLVIDDVITTGATIQAAIEALKDAGAEHIIPLALAH